MLDQVWDGCLLLGRNENVTETLLNSPIFPFYAEVLNVGCMQVQMCIHHGVLHKTRRKIRTTQRINEESRASWIRGRAQGIDTLKK